MPDIHLPRHIGRLPHGHPKKHHARPALSCMNATEASGRGITCTYSLHAPTTGIAQQLVGHTRRPYAMQTLEGGSMYYLMTLAHCRGSLPTAHGRCSAAILDTATMHKCRPCPLIPAQHLPQTQLPAALASAPSTSRAHATASRPKRSCGTWRRPTTAAPQQSRNSAP